MAYCANCERSDLAGQWQWCPRCGPSLTAMAPAQSTEAQSTSRTEMFLNVALTAAQGFVQGHVERKLEEKLAIPMKMVNAFVAKPSAGAGAALPSQSGTPTWYAAAGTPKPQLSDAEQAIVEAERIAKAESAANLGRMVTDHMNSMNKITLGGGNS